MKDPRLAPDAVDLAKASVRYVSFWAIAWLVLACGIAVVAATKHQGFFWTFFGFALLLVAALLLLRRRYARSLCANLALMSD